MTLVAVTQRVDTSSPHGERRDALDQRWTALLCAAGVDPLPVPNALADPEAWLKRVGADGVLLTGGNDLAVFGGDAPERDALEATLIRGAIADGLPVLAVCRGMQVVLDHFGVALQPVDGHVGTHHELAFDGTAVVVNSFHTWGATTSVPELDVLARADDGVIEAVRHRTHPVLAMMWHPERHDPLRSDEVEMIARHFGATS